MADDVVRKEYIGRFHEVGMGEYLFRGTVKTEGDPVTKDYEAVTRFPALIDLPSEMVEQKQFLGYCIARKNVRVTTETGPKRSTITIDLLE